MIRIIVLVVFLFLVNYTTTEAQHILTLEEAVETGLKENFGILIARNNADIDVNNQTLGNAGFLPSVIVDGSRTRRIEDSETKFTSPAIPNVSESGVVTDLTRASATLNWTIFDGLRMFTTYNRLGKLRELGLTQARLEIENTVANIIDAYAAVIGQKKAYQVLQNTVEVSLERIRIAETRKDLGSASEFDLLQARADLNSDSTALIRAETNLINAKVNLNELMGRDPETEFDTGTALPVAEDLELAFLQQQSISENTSLMAARLNQRIAEDEIKEIQGERYPELNFNFGYNYNKSEGGAGIVDLSRTDGFNYGISARLNLFDGFNVNRRKQNAEIRLKNIQLSIEETRLRVKSDLQRVYQSYLNALRLIELEEQSLDIAEQSQEIALERFRLGTIDSIELREAQQTLINAENRLIIAQVEAKNAETELLRLSGQLVSE